MLKAFDLKRAEEYLSFKLFYKNELLKNRKLDPYDQYVTADHLHEMILFYGEEFAQITRDWSTHNLDDKARNLISRNDDLDDELDWIKY